MQNSFVPGDLSSDLRRSTRRDNSLSSASSRSERASYDDFDGNSGVGDAFLELLNAIARVTRKLILRQPRQAEVWPCYGRLDRKITELTVADDREAV